MPGSQLVNRLQDLNYRVHAITDPAQLLECAQTEGPMLIFLDIEPPDTQGFVSKLRAEKTTAHIPIVVFGNAPESRFTELQDSGATLVVGESALLAHLPGLLDQALRIE